MKFDDNRAMKSGSWNTALNERVCWLKIYVPMQTAYILMERMKMQDKLTKQVDMSYWISFCVVRCHVVQEIDTNTLNVEVFCHAKRTVGVYLTNNMVSEATRAQS